MKKKKFEQPQRTRVKGKLNPVMTKVSDAEYQRLKDLQIKLGYASIYELVKGLISLELRFMEDYPIFHDGKQPTCFDDLKDMLGFYQDYRVGDRG